MPGFASISSAGGRIRNSKDLGVLGEEIARSFLMRKGFQFIERNWKFGRGELDLIFCDREELVFVEVKTRVDRGYSAQFLLDAVGAAKSKQLERLALSYLKRWPATRVPRHRIDVVGVLLSSDASSVLDIEHIKAAVGQRRV